ncbi:ATP-dependent DNA helicase PIF1-like [Senna tora]|uniref:ATP-dependent DNA helicase PIF1-like n=1 Tax=Senna tora TaxID=362788 RepID=A0A834SSR8_9FABA|nr:ATP-dependent DNA helicase PIF1-like [Senna tora]
MSRRSSSLHRSNMQEQNYGPPTNDPHMSSTIERLQRRNYLSSKRGQKFGPPSNDPHMSSTVARLQPRNYLLSKIDVGNGTVGGDNVGNQEIEIPDDLLIKEAADPIKEIVNTTYPSFLDNLDNIKYFQDRAILCPILENVEAINNFMLSLLPGEEVTYLSSDSICKSDTNVQSLEDVYTPDILNSIRCSGVPNHLLKLKVGAPIMLLRNLDRSIGLCNGSRLIITQLGKHVLEARSISGSNVGQEIFIPRTVLTPSYSSLQFRFQRRQFPISLCLAMTINKSQGQSLSQVGF